MGCLVGSAVGPAALSILLQTANGKAIGGGAVGGFCLAMASWVIRAQMEFGEVTYGSMMSDWPWVVGNLGALIGGATIAFVGSVIWPDESFQWEQLNDSIPLVDDVEPPPDDEFFAFLTKIAIVVSVCGSVFLVFLWPIPMHLW